ncbi:STT3 domain-containing protein [Helicobacter sp. 23-1045]
MIEKARRFYEFLARYFVIDIILMIVAMACVLHLRLAYADSTQFMPQYFFNDERILTTNDGYHYANATRDRLEGNKGDSAFFPSAEFEMPALLSVTLYKILPFSLDELFFYMPMVLSILLVIPVFLITKNFSNSLVAFFAALLAPITQAYSVRTMGGYYDTDMLILTIPLFVAYFLLKILDSAKLRYAILGAIFGIMAIAWHTTSAVALLGAGVFLGICYALIFKRDDLRVLELLGVLIIALCNMNIFLKLALLAVYLHFVSDKVFIAQNLTNQIKAKLKYKSVTLFLVALAIGLLSNVDRFISSFALYVVAGDTLQNANIIVRGVTDTIMELKPLDFYGAVVRIIGDYTAFTIGALGILLLFYKKPQTLVLLPFALLGLLSIKLGIRFSMFASPVFAIGVFYFVYFVLQGAKQIFDDKIVIYGVKIVSYAVIAGVCIIPHFYFGKNIGYAPALYSEEMGALNEIRADSASRENVTISWWDYGFLTSYYTNTRAIISGIDMDGVMHFVAAKIITETNQKAAYNLMNIATNLYFEKDDKKMNLVEKIIAKYGTSDNPNAVFENMEHFSGVEKQREIYIFIPYQLFELTATIEQFSDIDLRNGKATRTDKKLVRYYSVGVDGDEFVLDEKVRFNPKNGVVTDIESGKTLQVKAFHRVERVHNTLQTDKVNYENEKGALIAVFSVEMGRFFLIDERTNDSLLVQFFLYENYDRKLFQMLYKSPHSKAWKVR